MPSRLPPTSSLVNTRRTRTDRSMTVDGSEAAGSDCGRVQPGRTTSGPTYLDDGRMIFPAAACSTAWVHQPTVRLTANVGVNIERGGRRWPSRPRRSTRRCSGAVDRASSSASVARISASTAIARSTSSPPRPSAISRRSAERGSRTAVHRVSEAHDPAPGCDLAAYVVSGAATARRLRRVHPTPVRAHRHGAGRRALRSPRTPRPPGRRRCSRRPGR